MQTFFFFLKPFFKATSRYNNNKKSTKAFGQHLEQRFSLPVDWRRCQMILFISQGRARLGSLPLHWKMHFSEVKVSSPLWCLQGVLGFNCASAQANVLLWTGLDTGVTGVCVCVWVSGCVVAFYVSSRSSFFCVRWQYHLPCSISSLFSILCKWQCFGLEVVSGGGGWWWRRRRGGRKTSRRVIHILGFSPLLPVSFYGDIFLLPPPPTNTPHLQLNIQTQTG